MACALSNDLLATTSLGSSPISSGPKPFLMSKSIPEAHEPCRPCCHEHIKSNFSPTPVSLAQSCKFDLQQSM